MGRRLFTQLAGTALDGSLLSPTLADALVPPRKKRVAMVGTGHRGLGMWGTPVLAEHGSHIEFVGFCDKNPGRVATGKRMLGVSCPTYTDFDKMMRETKPDVLIVTTVDATHNEFIVKGMEYGADIVTEKPMTTDEQKCQQILDAEQRTGKKVSVTFNYRLRIPNNEDGHGGGDVRLHKQIFAPTGQDPYRQAAGTHDGAMACLVGITARHSIDSGKPVKIGDLTTLKPSPTRGMQE